ncbi:MAG: MASE1 domain-containing protein [Lysobacteraceae bacterium]
MADDKGSTIAKGMALAVAYGAAYLALRHISFNQWFLPAGLRMACLLFLPYRYWPYVFLGEAGATLSQKIKLVEDYGPLWVYMSSVFLAPLSSLAPLLVRKKLKTSDAIARWLPLIALPIAAWSSISKMSLNYILNGPVSLVTFENFTRYVVGDFLGILMIILPFLLLRGSKTNSVPYKRTLQSTAIAGILTGGLFCLLKLNPTLQGPIRQLLLLLMIAPAVFLTFAHGWHGAAVGIIAVNLGIAMTLEYTGIPGAYDDMAFSAQLGLALAAVAFLLLGSRITAHYEQARQSGLAEQSALKLAQTQLLTNEPILRDQLICMARLQVIMDEARDQLGKELRANGKHQEALDLNNQGVLHRQIFDEQALALYPIGIERYGLFAVIDSSAFRESRASGLEVAMRFGRSDPQMLSEDLQVLSYRCLCHAIDLLSDWGPQRYRLDLRVWHGSTQRGIYVSTSVDIDGPLQHTSFGEGASLLLDARMQIYRGILRRTPTRIRFVLSESNAIAAARPQIPVSQ